MVVVSFAQSNNEKSVFDLRGASKFYGESRAVDGIDLSVGAGRTTVLIGPSGCGKSTLLRLMVGLIAPDRGEIVFEGQRLSDANVLDLRQRMGYVIQDGGLFPHLTGRNNVAIMANHLRWDDGRIERRLAELSALTRFPIEGLDRFPAQLSGGQRQRVSLMRALMLDPDVLLLDEPLGALDPMIRADLQGDLCDIFRSLHKTVVLVTHDLSEASYLGDRIVLLRDGAIVQEGSPEDLLRAPADSFVTRFIYAQRGPFADDERDRG